MKSIAQNKRYLQHEVTTKLYAVRLYRQAGDVQYVCRRYHISKASLMRWNKQYDGTRESLEPKSHRPKTPHPNAHTEEELTWIRNLHRRNPNISVCEMYGKLREEKAYSRHPGSLYRVFVRLGYRRKVESTKKKSKHLGKYDTPTKLGVKWQMDVKYVPKICYAGKDGEVFFQYTIIEEASRKRFIYAYKEQSSFSTVDFVKRAITFFWLCTADRADRQRRRVLPYLEDEARTPAGPVLPGKRHCSQDHPPAHAVAQRQGRAQPSQRSGTIL